MENDKHGMCGMAAVMLAIGLGFAAVLLIILYFLAVGFIVMLCWNKLVPVIGWNQISLVDGIVLFILAQLLFAGNKTANVGGKTSGK